MIINLCRKAIPDLIMSYNQENALIYDLTTGILIKCATGFYLNHGECCANGEYFNRVNDACETIDNVYTHNPHNCLQLDEDQRCSLCADTFFLTGEFCCGAD